MVTKFFKNNYNLRKSLYTLGVVILSIVFLDILKTQSWSILFLRC